MNTNLVAIKRFNVVFVLIEIHENIPCFEVCNIVVDA